jgi:hypothetical protein
MLTTSTKWQLPHWMQVSNGPVLSLVCHCSLIPVEAFIPLTVLHNFDGSSVNILAVVSKVLGLQVVTTRTGKEIEKQSVVLCDKEHPHGVLLVL